MSRRLGLIAGSGRLPFEVAEAAARAGSEVSIVAIEGNTDPEIEQFATGSFAWVAAGELEKLIGFLTGAGADEVILAGAVAKREMLRDPAALRPDARALALLARLSERGDDTILSALARELESEGFSVVASTQYLGDRLTRPGVHGTLTPSKALLEDLELGLRVALSLGVHDVGQSAIVKQGSVLALEAAEGTDAAIRRGAEIGGPGAALVKAAKPGQDLRFDVPAIGPETLELAAEVGICGIGLEAERTLVLERDRVRELSEAAGIPIVGLRSRDS